MIFNTVLSKSFIDFSSFLNLLIKWLISSFTVSFDAVINELNNSLNDFLIVSLSLVFIDSINSFLTDLVIMLDNSGIVFK